MTAQVVQTDPSRPSATAAKRNGTDPISAKSQGVASEAAPSSLSEAPENRRRKLFSRTSSRPTETDPPPVNPEPISAQSEGVAPEAAPPGDSDAPDNGRRVLFSRTSSRGAEIEPPPPASTEPPEPQAISYPPEKRRSFLDRLLGRRPPEATIGDLLAAAWEREHAAEAGNDVAAPTPPETAPTLLGKLSALPADELHEAIEDEDDGSDDPALEDDAGDDIDDDDHQSLTSSVMEVQAKLAPKPAQIRSFPWLRG